MTAVSSLQTESGVKIPEDLVLVGYVSGAYGLAGWVRVKPYSSDADALVHAKTWWLGNPDVRAKLRDVEIMQTKLHSGDVLARLVGIEGRDHAEALKGAIVQVSRSYFPPLSDGEFYWVDLIGLEVENLQGERLGSVKDMMDNGAHPILKVHSQVESGAGQVSQEFLIPFVDRYVKTVDQEAKKITVDWGLDY